MSLGRKYIDIVEEFPISSVAKEYKRYETATVPELNHYHKIITIEPLTDKRWRIAGLC